MLQSAGANGAKLPPADLPKEALIERYKTHTSKCKDCSGALNNVRILRAAATVIGTVAMAMATASAVAAVTMAGAGAAAATPAWVGTALMRTIIGGVVAAAVSLFAWLKLGLVENAFMSGEWPLGRHMNLLCSIAPPATGPYPPYRQKPTGPKPLTVVAASVVLSSVA